MLTSIVNRAIRFAGVFRLLAGGAVFMPLSLAAQLVFTQSSTTTLTNSQAIGTAVKNEGETTFVYVAADGNVQKYSTALTPIGSGIPDLAGIQAYMNSGIGNTLSFSTLSTGLRDMNTDGTPAGIGYGPSQATSISKQFVDASGDVYMATFESGNFNLYNKTTNTSTLIASGSSLGISGNGLIDFVGFNGANNVSNATFVVASSDGYIQEYNLTTGLTGNSGNLALIGLNSNDRLSGLSYYGNNLAYTAYNPDFNVSLVNYGDLSGITAVPEPSTYALMAGASSLLFGCIMRRRSRIGAN